MSVEARAALYAAISAGEQEIMVRAHLLAHPELEQDEKNRLRALCRFLDQENERAMERWFEARVACGFAEDTPPTPRPASTPRRDVDDDDWSPQRSLI